MDFEYKKRINLWKCVKIFDLNGKRETTRDANGYCLSIESHLNMNFIEWTIKIGGEKAFVNMVSDVLFVWETSQTNSYVIVGQFDGISDPSLN